ncbi:MAG: dCTP deaminase, partial [candidate division Zixibacteria bacterium]|nr:dCTP deaminase [candidate division Zixibacteria bacterium]
NTVVELYENDEKRDLPVGFRHITVAAWMHEICRLNDQLDPHKHIKLRNQAEKLSLKAVESNYIHHKSMAYKEEKLAEGLSKKELGLTLPPTTDDRVVTGVLNTRQILDRLNATGEEKLFITPILSLDQISDGSVDIRLGNEFIVMRRTEFPSLDVAAADIPRTDRQIGQYQNKYKIDFGERFVLHPRELVLGSTFEFLALPDDIFAYVLSRSSWGRLGLMVATATAINPGYKGCLTLELMNLGEVPLVLYPGLPVAQLILQRAARGRYQADYESPTGPEFSNVHFKRIENSFWSNPFGPWPPFPSNTL